MKRPSRATSIRLASVLALVLAASLTLVPALAAGDSGEEGTPSPQNTVYIRDGKKGLRFVPPKFIYAGEELTVLNQTDPHKVGPHTFSLVTKGSLPKTPRQRQLCFTPHHICKAIAAWHGVKGEGPPKENPAEAGEEGWDTLGNLNKKGDSWFTGSKPDTSETQVVSAAGGTRLYFVCAIHPWMHGSIAVRPAPAG